MNNKLTRTHSYLRTPKTGDGRMYFHPIFMMYACERTLDRIKGVRYYRELLGPAFPVIEWVEGTLAETADLSGVSETSTPFPSLRKAPNQ